MASGSTSREVELAEYRQELDLRRAVLTRRLRFRDAEGRETAIDGAPVREHGEPERGRAGDDAPPGQLVRHA